MNKKLPSQHKSLFSGGLNTKIFIDPIEYLIPPSLIEPGGSQKFDEWRETHKDRLAEKIARERRKKLSLLFKHYKIDLNNPDWQRLAINLAYDTVPGFQVSVPKKEGPKNKWNELRLLVLWWDVRKICLRPRKSPHSACGLLASKEPWASLIKIRNTTNEDQIKEERKKQLYQQYIKAKKSDFVVLFSNMLGAGVPETSIEEFVDFFRVYEKEWLPKSPYATYGLKKPKKVI